jgi:hypothetical protein
MPYAQKIPKEKEEKSNGYKVYKYETIGRNLEIQHTKPYKNSNKFAYVVDAHYFDFAGNKMQEVYKIFKTKEEAENYVKLYIENNEKRFKKKCHT